MNTHGWENSFGPIFAYYNDELFGKIERQKRDLMVKIVSVNWQEQFEELQGMAEVFASIGHPEVNITYLCSWVYFHELAHVTEYSSNTTKRGLGCTGILAVDSQTQLVTHGRNLDNIPRELRNVTLHHSWKRQGAVIFESITYYWFGTGVVTALKRGTATLEENWRFEEISEESAFSFIANGTLPQIMWFRHLLLSNMSFPEIQSFVQSTPVAAAMYVIMSGPGARQGAVYSLSQGTNRNVVYDLASSNFIVQTNYDRWKEDPIDDNRRSVAEANMRAYGTTDPLTLLGVLSTYPVYNPETTFSCIMASTGQFQCFLRQPITLEATGQY